MERLEGGDMFRRKIFSAIDEAQLFLAIVSRSTVGNRARFFHREWNHAADRISDFPQGRPWIIPVFIDDLHERDAPIPEEFLEAQVVHLTQVSETARYESEVASLTRRVHEILGKLA